MKKSHLLWMKIEQEHILAMIMYLLVELEEKKQHWPKRIGRQTKKEEVDLFDKGDDINKIDNNVSDKYIVEEKKRKGRQTFKRKVNLLDEEFVVEKDFVHEKSEKEERQHCQLMKKKKVDTKVNSKNEEEDKNEELLPKRKRSQTKKKEVDLLDDEKETAELDNGVSDQMEEKTHVGEQYLPTRKGRHTIKGKMNPLNKKSVVEENDVCDKSEERQYCRPKRNRRQPGWRKVFQLIEGDEIEELDGISGQSRSVGKKKKNYLPLHQEEDEDFQFQEEKELQPQKKKRGHLSKHCSSSNPGSIFTIQQVADKHSRDRHTHIGHTLPSEVASSSQKAPPLTQQQQEKLVSLVEDRGEMLTSQVMNPKLLVPKALCWENIAQLFNASNPEQDPRSAKQLKRCWEHMKRKMKADNATSTKGKKNPKLPSRHPVYSQDLDMAKSIMGNKAREFGVVLKSPHTLSQGAATARSHGDMSMRESDPAGFPPPSPAAPGSPASCPLDHPPPSVSPTLNTLTHPSLLNCLQLSSSSNSLPHQLSFVSPASHPLLTPTSISTTIPYLRKMKVAEEEENLKNLKKNQKEIHQQKIQLALTEHAARMKMEEARLEAYHSMGVCYQTIQADLQELFTEGIAPSKVLTKP
ncbi:hypothetical protein Pmani_016588 [Petrolisthes manimaculis]|uniref:Regulatory protein zeste n=1 Tax=Petrolisthes manimaculis TaxID=1843537 RepID=A0AAE1U6J9_9EUCA|nr:hypothetical protein Pmani_016588 [Petrolisthes manimaculis]